MLTSSKAHSLWALKLNQNNYTSATPWSSLWQHLLNRPSSHTMAPEEKSVQWKTRTAMCRFLLEGQFKVHLLEGQLKVQGAGEGRAVRQIYTQIEPKLKRETACCPMALRQAEFIRKSDDQPMFVACTAKCPHFCTRWCCKAVSASSTQAHFVCIGSGYYSTSNRAATHLVWL